MQIFNARYKLWWRALVLGYLAVAFGLTAYWLVTESGLFGFFDKLFSYREGRWPSEVEVHHPTLAFLVTLLLVLVPLLVVRLVVGKHARVDDPNDVMTW